LSLSTGGRAYRRRKVITANERNVIYSARARQDIITDWSLFSYILIAVEWGGVDWLTWE
jgi:hypothetical protein